MHDLESVTVRSTETHFLKCNSGITCLGDRSSKTNLSVKLENELKWLSLKMLAHHLSYKSDRYIYTETNASVIYWRISLPSLTKSMWSSVTYSWSWILLSFTYVWNINKIKLYRNSNNSITQGHLPRLHVPALLFYCSIGKQWNALLFADFVEIDLHINVWTDFKS